MLNLFANLISSAMKPTVFKGSRDKKVNILEESIILLTMHAYSMNRFWLSKLC